MQVVKLALAVTSCLAIRSAAAQPAQTPVAPPPPAVAEVSPPSRAQSVLPNLLSTEVGVTLDGRIDHSKLDSEDLGFLALHLHGQYIGRYGLGGYLALPIARVSGGDQSEIFVGNVELGGLAVLRSGGAEIYARGGFTVSTGTDEDDLGEGLLVPLANFVPRLADALPTGFGTSWLRAGVGVRGTSGAMVFGGSGGVDFPLASDDIDGLLHLSGSIGVAQPGFGVAIGITLLRSLEDSDENNFGFQLLGDGAIGRRMRVYGALGFDPEDDGGGYSLGVGVRAGL